MKTFRDKVAVITGAGSGMGRYLALLLANIPLASRFDISDNASIQQLIMNR